MARETAMPQHPDLIPRTDADRDDATHTPTPRHRRATAMTAADLVATGTVSAQQAYAATLVLARLHDRGVGRTLTLEDICEVLGYTGNSRRPASIPEDRVAPSGLRRGPKAN